MAKRITLGYIGVHQIFQLALAAHEIDSLNTLYCSLVQGRRRWGSIIQKVFPSSLTHPQGAASLPSERVVELPLPMLARSLSRRALRRGATDYFHSNRAFDKSVAKRLAKQNGEVFVGVESCALESLRTAKRLGMHCILECPGIPSGLLRQNVASACDELGIVVPLASETSRMKERKEEELALADTLFLCSEIQRSYYESAGFQREQLHVNPLWVDPLFQSQIAGKVKDGEGSGLRVLYVGRGSVAKGVPYLLSAMQQLGKCAQLTLCGGVDGEVAKWAKTQNANYQIIPWVDRKTLASIYQQHDVLVFPSLGDSFGFVAVEAMASGLPVIATTCAGAPLPDPSWRVPPRDTAAIAERLQTYADDRESLKRASQRARDFTATMTPQAYRSRAANRFAEILALPTAPRVRKDYQASSRCPA